MEGERYREVVHGSSGDRGILGGSCLLALARNFAGITLWVGPWDIHNFLMALIGDPMHGSFSKVFRGQPGTFQNLQHELSPKPYNVETLRGAWAAPFSDIWEDVESISLGAQGFGLGVAGLGLGVGGLGFRVEGLGFRV